ncbi:MAG: hypothetical protein M3046_13235 [Actinomycetota bacterium]|nr:hypothetical protein [Actinomycetota bacterium]
MPRRVASILAPAALAALAVAASVLPAGAGRNGPVDPTVTGQASCQADGTYSIVWTFDFTDPASDGHTIDVSNPAVLSGAVTGQVDFNPKQFTAPGTSTGQHTLPGTTAGVVDLQRGWGDLDTMDGGAVHGQVTLDGTCTPAAQVPAAPEAAAAVAATPVFTG